MDDSIMAEIARKQGEAYKLSRELLTYVELRKLGINKEDINGKRRVKKKYVPHEQRWEWCTDTCQVRLKDGSEHIVPLWLMFGEE